MGDLREPQTPAEWQEAADAASLALALDAAVQYGLVERLDEHGNPLPGSGVNLDRAQGLLDQAAERGVRPRPLAELLLGGDA